MLKRLLDRLHRKDKGFTLIEVVIVLAIAGLIFVIVFLAVSAAQRARRDNARQDAANRLLAAAEQFAGNRNGAYPTAVADFGTGATAIFNNSGNPDNPAAGWTLNITAVTAVGGAAASNLYFSVGNAGCNTTNGTVPAAAAGRVARVQVALESGVIYCRDNA